MAVTWDAFKKALRKLVRDDAAGTERWSDEVLLWATNQAIVELSSHAPQPKTLALVPDGVIYTFTLPEDLVALRRVRYEDQWLEALDPRREVLPMTITTSSEPWVYLKDWPDEGQITFAFVPKKDVPLQLHYGAARAKLAGTDDEVLPLGRHIWMEQALVFYAAYLINAREGVARAALEQWSERPENNVGNPLNSEARFMLAQYERVLAQSEGGDGA
jgi:hypothetical protein